LPAENLFGNVTAMALSPAEKQQRYRDRQKTKVESGLETITAALMTEVERAQRDELSDQERVALAERLANLAIQHQWRASTLAKLAMKVRANDREISAAWWQDEIVPKIAQAKK
jgi:hypothetical protein